jgi:hypothetical protein
MKKNTKKMGKALSKMQANLKIILCQINFIFLKDLYFIPKTISNFKIIIGISL